MVTEFRMCRILLSVTHVMEQITSVGLADDIMKQYHVSHREQGEKSQHLSLGNKLPPVSCDGLVDSSSGPCNQPQHQGKRLHHTVR